MRRVALLFALLCIPGFSASGAWATDPKLSPVSVNNTEQVPGLKLELTPILGKKSPRAAGWFSYLLTAHNPTAEAIAGRLSLVPATFGARSDPQPLLETELSVPPGATIRVELPVYGQNSQSVVARLVGAKGVAETQAESQTGYQIRPLLLDLDENGGAVHQIRESPLPGTTRPGGAVLQIAATRALFDSRTGQALLPERSVSYGAATLVLANVETLDSLREPQRRALVGWVLSGGSLAITTKTLAGLGSPLLSKMLGASPETGPVSAKLLDPQGRPKSLAEELHESALDPPGHSSELLSALQGFQGVGLHPSPWGSSSSYGLGEVHLLGFTPNRGLFRGAEFTRSRLLTLVAHAWQRRSHIASPLGQTSPDDPRHQAVARQLDPNAENHWALVGATLILLVYALLAGPVNFQLAANAGKPLRALIRLPIWSLAALASILMLGIWSRGGQERARHLTFLEAAAGMSVSNSVSFRAFNSASHQHLRIGTSAPDHVLGLTGKRDRVAAQLSLTQTGLQVRSILAKPWKTLVVREDGFAKIGNGVSLTLDAGELRVKNRTGRELVGVVVRGADGRLFGFDALADGAETLVSAGKAIPVRGAPARSTGYPLMFRVYQSHLDKASPGLADAWSALAAVCDPGVDWWPADVPALIAGVAGGQGRLSDTGIPLEQDRVLLRVVGYGAAQ